MIEVEDKLRLLDKDYTFGIMREQANQHLKFKKYTVKFPCHDVSVEVLKPEDIYLECPECHKKYLLTQSANRNKLWSDG